MSNEDLYGPGFSEDESDESVFEMQRLVLEQEEAMQKCEDDLKRNTEQFHHEMSQLNLKYERQYERTQELEAQNQMKDEQIRRLENELQAKEEEIIKLEQNVAKFKAKMLPLCPSPLGKRKIRHGKSPSPSPQLPDSSDSCSLKQRGTRMKKKPERALPRTPPKLNKGIHLNHLDQL